MTKGELEIELQKIKVDAHHRTKAAIRDYVKSNDMIQAGDIVTDRIGSVRVDRILIDLGNRCSVYEGVELLKSGKPNKKGTIRRVWQSNLLSQDTKQQEGC